MRDRTCSTCGAEPTLSSRRRLCLSCFLSAVFREKVDKNGTGGCWLWTGHLDSDGYAFVNYTPGRGKPPVFRGAHRIAYELAVGPIPDGYQIDHVKARGCVHKHCVNPAHLEAVTHQENMRRSTVWTSQKRQYGRAARPPQTHCRRGHEFTPENTKLRSDGSRQCRACVRLSNNAFTARRRSQRATER